jgi:hypothetical protein
MWSGAICTYCDQDYQKDLTELHVGLEQNDRYACPACNERFDVPINLAGLTAEIPWYQPCSSVIHACPNCKKLLSWKNDRSGIIEKTSSRLIFALSFLLAYRTPEHIRVFFPSWWSLGTFYVLIGMGMLSASLVDKSLWKHGASGMWLPYPILKKSQAVKLYLLVLLGVISLILILVIPQAFEAPIWFILLSVFAAITASNLILWHRNRTSKRNVISQ